MRVAQEVYRREWGELEGVASIVDFRFSISTSSEVATNRKSEIDNLAVKIPSNTRRFSVDHFSTPSIS